MRPLSWMRGVLREAEQKTETASTGGNTNANASATQQPAAIDYTKLAAALAPHLEKLVPKQAAAAQETSTDTKAAEQTTETKTEGNKTQRQAFPKVEDDPKFKTLTAEVERMRVENESKTRKAEEKERAATVKNSLSDFQFQNENAKNTAFALFKDAIKLGEDGETYVGPNGEPATQYIAREMENTHDYLLAPKPVGGAGATNGGGRSGSKSFNLEDIKPGMKAEDLQAMRAHVALMTRNVMSGQA